MAGKKYDKGKVRMELLPPLALLKVAEILTFGAEKYDPWNWSKGIAYSRLHGALLRHLSAWQRGEDIDPESGLPHLAHAACNAVMLLEMAELRKDLDDRPIHYKKKKK